MKKIFCQYCGKMIKNPAKYCPACGKALDYGEKAKDLEDAKCKDKKVKHSLKKYVPSTAFLVILFVFARWSVWAAVNLWRQNNYRLNTIDEIVETSKGALNRYDFKAVNGSSDFNVGNVAIAEKVLPEYGEMSIRLFYRKIGDSVYANEKPYSAICYFSKESWDPKDREVEKCATDLLTWVIYRADRNKVIETVKKAMSGSSVSYKGYKIVVTKSQNDFGKNIYQIQIGNV